MGASVEPVGPLSSKADQQPIDPNVFQAAIQKSQSLQGQVAAAVVQGTDQGVQVASMQTTVSSFNDFPPEVRDAFLKTRAWEIIHDCNESDRRLKDILRQGEGG